MSPPMLRSRTTRASQPVAARPTDPATSIVVALLSLTAVGLLLAGILAVYTWSTPDAEAPTVLLTAIIFGVALLTTIAFSGIRRLRRS